MSYARWSDASDVYVFLDAGARLRCSGCPLADAAAFDARTTAEMVRHLLEHRARGHRVPEDAFEALEADAAPNDAWMALPPEARSAFPEYPPEGPAGKGGRA